MLIEKKTKEYEVPEGMTFFDIETTGFDARSSYVYLIGFMRKENEKTVLTQLFCEDFNEEKQLLLSFIKELKDGNTLVHYNGTAFDIRFINAKFKRHAIDYYIDPDTSFDVYKTILHYKKYLRLENTKLKTVEKAAGYRRTDEFTGEDLITLYSELTGRIRLAKITKKEYDIENAKAIVSVILLHNSDDIEGLYQVYDKTNVLKVSEGRLLPENNDMNSFEFSFIFPLPLLPTCFEANAGYCFIANGENKTEIVLPVINGEMKFFLPDYENYTYLTDSDTCIPNAIASGVDKKSKKKCTPKTAYIRKEGSFIQIPSSMLGYCETNRVNVFKRSYGEKEFFLDGSDAKKHLFALAKSLINEL